MFTNKDIAGYFELCEVHYRQFWNLDKSKSMHYGYWDKDTRNFHEALMNINKVMAAKTGITTGQHVLDAGCGVGGSSIWLAKNTGCQVTGITLSTKQRDQAENTAAKELLTENAKFVCADYTNTGFPSASFDVVWAIESVCYAPDKSAFLKEAYRLLKPGGKLIVADFFNKYGLEGKDKELIDKMAYGWAVTEFATVEDFSEDARQTGFTKIQVDNISEAVYPSARRMYYCSFPGMIGTALYALFKKPSRLTNKHARTAYLQYKGLQQKLWQYQVFLLEK